MQKAEVIAGRMLKSPSFTGISRGILPTLQVIQKEIPQYKMLGYERGMKKKKIMLVEEDNGNRSLLLRFRSALESNSFLLWNHFLIN